MLPRLRRAFADRRIQQYADALVAVALLVGSLAEIADGRAEWSGPRGVEVVLAVACTVPLVWRRSHPLAVAAIVVSAALGTAALVAPVQGPFESFVVYVLVVYSVGVYAPPRRSLVALAAIVAASTLTWLVVAATTEDANYGDWLPTLVWAAGAWLVGRGVRSRTERTRELERLTVELEAERDARAHEAVVVERARIARELHDVVAHNISVMSVQAAAASRVMQGDEPDVRRALTAIETVGRETVDEMRRMLGILRRSDDELALAPQPSLRDLDALVEQVGAAGLDVDVRIEGVPRPLPAGLDLSAYRIVQEALTNALKHAAPAHVDVVVRYLADAVVIEVADDGARHPAGLGTGNGLVGMRERAALFGGELRAGGRAGGGWSLEATLPIGAA